MSRKKRKTKISDLIVYRDEITVNGSRKKKLVFNNRMLGYAEQYYMSKGFEKSSEDILKEAASVKLIAISAILYGAICAADSSYSVSQFSKDFKIDRIAEYIVKVAKGLTEFLPEKKNEQDDSAEKSTADNGGDMIGDYFELARKALGMTDEEILDSSLRIIAIKTESKLGIDDDSNAGYIDSVPGF